MVMLWHSWCLSGHGNAAGVGLLFPKSDLPEPLTIHGFSASLISVMTFTEFMKVHLLNSFPKYIHMGAPEPQGTTEKLMQKEESPYWRDLEI